MVTEAVGDKGHTQLIKHESLQESSFHLVTVVLREGGIAGYVSNQLTDFTSKTTLISLLLPGKQQKQTVITDHFRSQVFIIELQF